MLRLWTAMAVNVLRCPHHSLLVHLSVLKSSRLRPLACSKVLQQFQPHWGIARIKAPLFTLLS